MKILHNLKLAIGYVLPHLRPSRANIVKPFFLISSFIIPTIDLIVLSLYKNYTNSNSENNSTNLMHDNNSNYSSNSIFVVTSAIVGTTLYLKPVLAKIFNESLKVSIKTANSDKLLSDNKFLISGNHSELTGNIKSLQEVTVGYRVDILSDSVVALFITLPINLISIACGVTRIENISGFLKSGGYKVAFPVMAASAALIYKISEFQGKYSKQEAEINSALLARSSFIENNRDPLTLVGALDFEKKFMIKNLIAREKIIVPYAILNLANIIIAVGSGEFLIYYLASNAAQTIALPSIMYLGFSLYTLSNDLMSATNILGEGLSRFKDHAEKTEAFNNAYNQWSKIYDKNNTMQLQFGGEIFSIKNFSVLVGEKNDEAEIKTSEKQEKLEHLTTVEIEPKDIIRSDIILQNTTLNLEPGQKIQLMGASGTGKTTILKAIQYCWPYTQGTVIFPVHKEDIHFIPQKLCFPPNYSLLQIITYPLSIKKLSNKFEAKPEDIVSDIKLLLNDSGLSIDDLESTDHNWEGLLSGGEKQRIAIIGAIIKKPLFLIMDEVTASLDHATRIKMYKLIEKKLSGSTILYTDHHPIDFFADKELHIINQELKVITPACSLAGEIIE